MNFTSRCDQGISGLVERHQGGNCRASILEFLESRWGACKRVRAGECERRVPLPCVAPTVHQPSGFNGEPPRIHEEGRGGIVILQKRRRLSDELACVSTAETSPSLPPLLFPPSLTASMLLLANLRLRRFLSRIPNNDPEGN